ncbi:MAG: glycosyltransferase family 2 protein [Aquabacterium sp.]|nr:glycosyltransferase family 2 protein [Aquabacterium sp.]
MSALTPGPAAYAGTQPAVSPLVQLSVVMPSLNQAAFIERAVRSVFAQTGTALELVVMDGGSTDGTQALLARLGSEFGPALRWSSAPDNGPGHALNKALAAARGSVIGWLNADDVYTPGAVQRALAHLDAHPQHWMVYGHGEHIGAQDQPLGAYPSQLPQAGLQGFAQGCYICQPTVFLRRAALRGIGGFDERQRTAFDLALWLRLFSRHPDRIGWIDALQARSRLHGACITLTQRSQVIRESMALLAQHLGAAPLHWLQTHVDELIATHPFGQITGDPRAHVEGFAASVAALLSPADQASMRRWLDSDARIRLARPDACLQVDPDGWLLAQSVLRVRAGSWRSVRLVGRHVSPLPGPLVLQVLQPDGRWLPHAVPGHGPFDLQIALPASAATADLSLRIVTSGGFIPSQQDAASGDDRRLACQIDDLQLCP